MLRGVISNETLAAPIAPDERTRELESRRDQRKSNLGSLILGRLLVNRAGRRTKRHIKRWNREGV
jgi:hypothetical protein